MKKTLNPDSMPGWLAKLFAADAALGTVSAGINDDDCAVLKSSEGYLIASLDFLNANPIVLELGIGTMHDLGRLLVAANMSDLCGSGAIPTALLVGVTLPHGTPESDYKDLMRGVKHEAGIYNVPVVGGDSKLGKTRALMAVALGRAKSRRNLFLKNGAKAGNIIWSSGQLGSAAAAVWGYKRAEFGIKWRGWAKKASLIPQLPLQLSRNVSESRIGRGGTDVSDGLGSDLQTMCIASQVGAILEGDKIPVAKEVTQAAKLANVPPWSFAFASGGDFQFIVTTDKSVSSEMKQFGFYEIGEITKRKDLRVRLSNGQLMQLPIQGHRDHRGMTFASEIDFLIKEIAKLPTSTK